MDCPVCFEHKREITVFLCLSVVLSYTYEPLQVDIRKLAIRKLVARYKSFEYTNHMYGMYIGIEMCVIISVQEIKINPDVPILRLLNNFL